MRIHLNVFNTIRASTISQKYEAMNERDRGSRNSLRIASDDPGYPANDIGQCLAVTEPK